MAAAKVSCGDEFSNALRLPTSRTLDTVHKMKSGCWAVHHRENGDVLLGCEDGLWILDRADMTLKKSEVTEATVTSVVEHRNIIYMLTVSENEKGQFIGEVMMCLSDMRESQKLFEFKVLKAAFISVSDRYIVVYNFSESVHQQIIYDFNSKQCKTTQIDSPYLPHFLSDGHLLTVAPREDKLTKYKIEDGEMTSKWTCEGLDNAFAACSDSNGLIYVSTSDDTKTIYIIL